MFKTLMGPLKLQVITNPQSIFLMVLLNFTGRHFFNYKIVSRKKDKLVRVEAMAG